jgi:hypothetical protein
VAVGFVVTCIGMGAMMSLSIFLQPLSQAMGWSPRGHLRRRPPELPRHGPGLLRLGGHVRPVRHARGRHLRRRAPGRRARGGEPGQHPPPVSALLRRARRPGDRELLRPADRPHHEVVHRESEPGGGPGLRGHGARLHRAGPARARAHHELRLARGDDRRGQHRVAGDHPCRAPRAGARARRRPLVRRGGDPGGARADGGPGLPHAPVRRGSPSRTSAAARRTPAPSSTWSAMPWTTASAR